MKKFHIFIYLFLVFCLITSFVSIYADEYEYTEDWKILGDTVYINDSKVFASATPHTLSSSGWVYFEFESKIYDGNIDMFWGFNTNDTFPTKKVFIWRNYTHYYESFSFYQDEYVETFYDVTNYTKLLMEDYSNYSVKYGNLNNTKLYDFTYNNGDNHGTAAFNTWQQIGDGNDYQITGNETYRTTYNNSINYWDWKSFNKDYDKVSWEYENMTQWYILRNQTIQQGKRYKLKVWVNIEFSGFYKFSGKYWWGFKPSNRGLKQARQDGQLYVLDPWYDSEWSYRRAITVTNAVSGFQSLLKIGNTTGGDTNCNGHAQDDFDDLRFTEDDGQTLIPYWIENVTVDDQVWVWINNTAGDSTLYMYYGNATCGNVSDGEDTFILFDDFNDASFNGSMWEEINGDGTYTENNGYLFVDGDNAKSYGVNSKDDFGPSRLRGRTKVHDKDTLWTFWGYCHVDSGAPFSSRYRLDSSRVINTNSKFTTNCGDDNPVGDWESLDYATNADENYHVFHVNRSETSGGECSLDWQDNVTHNYWSNTDREILFANRGGAGVTGLYIDWVFLAKYSGTIPTFSFGGEHGQFCPEITITNEHPEDDEEDVELTPILTELNATVTITDSFPTNVTAWSNESGLWRIVNWNETGVNGVYHFDNASWVDSYNTDYWWSVNVTNDTFNCWYNLTFKFTTKKLDNNAPTIILGTEHPSNNSIGIKWWNLPLVWNVTIEDAEGSLFDWTIQTVGHGATSGNGEGNGSKSANLGALYKGAFVTVWVNATDTLGSGKTNHSIFYFTSRVNQIPFVTDVSPSNQSTGVAVGSYYLNVTVWDWDDGYAEEPTDVYWWTNASGQWINFAFDDDKMNGTALSHTYMNFLGYNKKYFWSVNLSDGDGGFNNLTFHFTTEELTSGDGMVIRNNVNSSLNLALVLSGSLIGLLFIFMYRRRRLGG